MKRYLERGIREVGTDDSEEVSPVVHQTCHHVWTFEERVIDCSGDIRLRRKIWMRRGEDDSYCTALGLKGCRFGEAISELNLCCREGLENELHYSHQKGRRAEGPLSTLRNRISG